MGLADILSRKNMRIFNLAACGLAIVAWVVRFWYFTAREELVEVDAEITAADGTTSTVTTLEYVEL